MALFGANAADNFQLITEARVFVSSSAHYLCYRPFVGPNAQQMRTQMECDIWEGMADVYLEEYPNANRVDVRLQRFVSETERLCRPIIDRSYAVENKKWWWHRK